MAEHRAEVAAITARPGPPTFDDTVVALERSGATLRRVSAVFFVLVGSLSTPGDPRDRGAGGAAARRARRRDHPGPGPVRPAGRAARRPPRTRPGPRVAAPAGTSSPRRGPSRCPPRPGRSGAAARAERRAVDVVHGVRHPAARRHERRGPRRRRPRRGSTGCLRTRSRPPRGPPRPAVTPAATCSRSCCPRTSPRWPPSPTAALRERLFRASISRGARGNEHDTRDVVRRITALRAERAGLLGHPHHASWVIEVGTAETVEAVEKMLAALVPHAVRNAEAEAAELAAARRTPDRALGPRLLHRGGPPRARHGHRGAAPVPRAGAGAAPRRVRRGGRALRAAVHRAARPARVPPGRTGVSRGT